MNPNAALQKFWKEAQRKRDATAGYLSLATVDNKGHPHVRTVLIKTLDSKGIGFVTNKHGRKVRQIQCSSIVEACIVWPSLSLQVRVGGRLKPMPKKIVEHFWKLRPREAQILYHLGLEQSSLLPSFEFLLEKVKKLDQKWENKKKIPLSPNYIGFILVPRWIEFLNHTYTRLNKRELFEKTKSGWKKKILAP